MSRTRIKTPDIHQGSKWSASGGWQLQSSPSLYEKCVDEKGVRDAAWYVVRNKQSGGLINYPNNGLNEFRNYRLDALASCSDSAVFIDSTFPDVPSNNTLVSKLLAETNPNRSDNSVLNFIWELKDIPHLMNFVGNDLLQSAGKSVLLYQYGWKPFWHDLARLFDFTTAFNKRVKELEALYSGQGIRRKRTLWSGANSTTTVRYLQSLGFNTGNVTIDHANIAEIYGTVTWKPTSGPPTSVRALRGMAYDATLGSILDAEVLWEAIPWSWLFDWYLHVGNYIAATKNRIPVAPSSIRLHVKKFSSHSLRWSHPNVSSWSGSTETKMRIVPSPLTVSADLPILTNRQLSILGSIAVVRRRPINLT